MLCQDCGSTIEEGWKDRAPVLAQFCLKCRSARRRSHNLKYAWLPQHDAYLRAHYHGGLHQRGRVIRELARQTGFPRWYIKRQARRLGLSMNQDRRPWTPAELDSLDRLSRQSLSGHHRQAPEAHRDIRSDEDQGPGPFAPSQCWVHHA